MAVQNPNKYYYETWPFRGAKRLPVRPGVVSGTGGWMDLTGGATLVNDGATLQEITVRRAEHMSVGDRVYINGGTSGVAIATGAGVDLGIGGVYNDAPIYVSAGTSASLVMVDDDGVTQTWLLEGNWIMWDPTIDFEAVWDPASLTLSDNDPVASWVDDVGGIDLTQGTAANQPSFEASSADISGHPSVVFDIGDGTEYLEASGPAILDATDTVTMFSVFARDGGTSGVTISKRNTGAPGAVAGYRSGYASTGALSVNLVDSGTMDFVTLAGGDVTTIGHALAISGDLSDLSGQFATTVDGVTLSTNGSAGGSLTNASNFVLGSNSDIAGGAMEGELFLACVDTRTAHTQAQLNLAVRYARHRFGI